MYESEDSFEAAIKGFGYRVDIIVAMEMAGKIDAETAYQNIKMELKDLKTIRKRHKKDSENA